MPEDIEPMAGPRDRPFSFELDLRDFGKALSPGDSVSALALFGKTK